MTVPPTPPTAVARRALIIDDEEVIRRAMRRFFQREGWAVDESEDGAGALALLLGAGAPAVDVILCDLRMPGMSGAAFFDAVAAARPALAARVIVTTGDPYHDGAAEFIARSGCAVLNKPFELTELRAVVEQVAGRS